MTPDEASTHERELLVSMARGGHAVADIVEHRRRVTVRARGTLTPLQPNPPALRDR